MYQHMYNHVLYNNNTSSVYEVKISEINLLAIGWYQMIGHAYCGHIKGVVDIMGGPAVRSQCKVYWTLSLSIIYIYNII